MDVTKIYPPGRSAPAPFAPEDPSRRHYAPPPENPKLLFDWHARLLAARDLDTKALARAEGAPTARPAWAASAFVEAYLPLSDRYLYDPDLRRYTVDRALDDLRLRYGGADVIILAAPNRLTVATPAHFASLANGSLDGRRPMDTLKDLPGGMPALAALVAALHRRGLTVLLDLGKVAASPEFARVVHEAGADGLLGESPAISLKTIFIEPSFAAGDDLAYLRQAPLAWGAAPEWSGSPGVDRFHWAWPTFRSFLAVSEAGASPFPYAWLNGTGFLLRENNGLDWRPLSAQDAEILRRMAMIYRALPSFPDSKAWEPYAAALEPSFTVSRWPLPDSGTVWTFRNAGHYSPERPLLEVGIYRGQHFYDLWTGAELFPDEKLIDRLSGQARLRVPIEAHGFGAVLETNEPPRIGSPVAMHLQAVRELSRENPAVVWLAKRAERSELRVVAAERMPRFHAVPEGMVRVEGAKAWRFRSLALDLGQAEESVRDVSAFFLDRAPVTNAQFRAFLGAREYAPRDPHYFLRHWPKGEMPSNIADRAVTWVSIEEARLYCASLGKRLPHIWEWQFAAQGPSRRRFPWGNTWDDAKVPRPGADVAVGSYAEGAGESGALDLTGLIWQWTDEMYDAHVRVAFLKGGPATRSARAPESEETLRYPLMDPSVDRSGAIGFRCAADAGAP